MNTFSQGFNHGFMHGMFNNMFGSYNMCNPFMFYNPAPTFFTPSYNFGSFYQYPSPLMQMPSVFNYSVPQFNFTSNYSSSFNTYATSPLSSITTSNYTPKTNKTSRSSDTPTKTTETPSKKTNTSSTSTRRLASVSRNDNDFDKMLDFVFQKEGGYTSNDCGEAGNYGVRQSTYDSYRTRKGLSKKDVKYITKEEARDLYYNDYYLASGADKIKDPRMALYVFDTAVNMGVSAAKELYRKSGDDLDKFENLRIARYENIANNQPNKAKYLRGWKNRVRDAENFANREFVA